jgi:hypothetical protein
MRRLGLGYGQHNEEPGGETADAKTHFWDRGTVGYPHIDPKLK